MIRSDFEKYYQSIKPFGMTALDSYVKKQNSLSPYILEEHEFRATQMDVFSRLMMDRIIWFNDEVDSRTSGIIQAQLLYLDQEPGPINLYINSPGGECYSGLGIYDTLQYIESETISLCNGLAASFGAVLLCACKKRYSLPNSTIMIHQPLISGGIGGQATDIDIESKEMQRIKKTLLEIIAKHSGKTYKQVWTACERNNYMTPQEAKDFGLIDDIIRSKSDLK